MATLAKRLITADEFLEIHWPDSDVKAELDNGVIRIIRMMAGGQGNHARIQMNVSVALAIKLRGSGCSPYGSDMGIRTHELSIRYPDVSVFCGRDGPENDKLKAFDDPKLVIEVLSPSTRDEDIKIKLLEYRNVTSLDAILYIDPEDETIHLEVRNPARGWVVAPVGADGSVTLPLFDIVLTSEEIFARGR